MDRLTEAQRNDWLIKGMMQSVALGMDAHDSPWLGQNPWLTKLRFDAACSQMS